MCCYSAFHTFVYINVLDHVISLVAKQLIKSQNDRAIDKTADVMFKKKKKSYFYSEILFIYPKPDIAHVFMSWTVMVTMWMLHLHPTLNVQNQNAFLFKMTFRWIFVSLHIYLML